MVSNSLSHLQNADRIIVLRDGQIELDSLIKKNDGKQINLEKELMGLSIELGKSENNLEPEIERGPFVDSGFKVNIIY